MREKRISALINKRIQTSFLTVLVSGLEVLDNVGLRIVVLNVFFELS
jgi:hypothetical protein